MQTYKLIQKYSFQKFKCNFQDSNLFLFVKKPENKASGVVAWLMMCSLIGDW